LVYGRVVQAHHALYTPQKDDFGAAGIVLVFALDEAHRYDEEWLAKIANRISEMKKNASENKPKGFFFTLCRLLDLEKKSIIAGMIKKKRLEIVPEDCRDFIGTLLDDQSSFCFPLGKSVSDGADAWCEVFWLDKPSRLPLSCIPYSKIIPIMVSGKPKLYKNNSILGVLRDMHKSVTKLIPPSYYTK